MRRGNSLRIDAQSRIDRQHRCLDPIRRLALLDDVRYRLDQDIQRFRIAP